MTTLTTPATLGREPVGCRPVQAGVRARIGRPVFTGREDKFRLLRRWQLLLLLRRLRTLATLLVEPLLLLLGGLARVRLGHRNRFRRQLLRGLVRIRFRGFDPGSLVTGWPGIVRLRNSLFRDNLKEFINLKKTFSQGAIG